MVPTHIPCALAAQVLLPLMNLANQLHCLLSAAGVLTRQAVLSLPIQCLIPLEPVLEPVDRARLETLQIPD